MEHKKYSQGLEFSTRGMFPGRCAVVGFGTNTDSNLVIPPEDPDGNKVVLISRLGSRDESVAAKVETAELPDSLETIGIDAFAGFRSIETITVPDTVNRICMGAFRDCTALREIEFGENTTRTMGADGCFWGCKSLERVAFHGNIDGLADLMFAECANLKEVHLGKPVEMGESVFAGCPDAPAITFNANTDSKMEFM